MKELRFMDRHQSFDSLQFNDHQVINYEIEAICSIDPRPSAVCTAIAASRIIALI
jgi:hypothetical protein